MNRTIDADVLIIGAGASGLAAACAASGQGASVIAVDGNPNPGKKLAATGNGRCNFTNKKCSPSDFNQAAESFVEQVFQHFGVEEALRFFSKGGMLIREEQEGRCYPYSGQASAVVDLLVDRAESQGVRFVLEDAVSSCSEENGIFTVTLSSGKTLRAGSLIIAAGGRAGMNFGSTGDGYGFAKTFGHSLNPPRPALVACESEDPVLNGLKGRARARVTLLKDEQKLQSEYGEVQFTGSGISGICVMNMTRFMEVSRPPSKKKKKAPPASVSAEKNQGGRSAESPKAPEYQISIDFIPEYGEDTIVMLLARSGGRVSLKEAASRLVNSRIAAVIAEQAEAEVSGSSRKILLKKMAELLKNFKVRIDYTKGWNDAQVTCGGIRLEELVPETMASRKVPGLFFCGEVVDVDGPCGGYNLQWAWSSGNVSGKSAAEYIRNA